MRIEAAAALAFFLIAASCSAPESIKFEKLYFVSVAEKVAKAEGVPYVPSPEVNREKPATTPVNVFLTEGTQAKEERTPPAVVKIEAVVAVPEKVSIPSAVTSAAGEKGKKKKFKVKELDISADSMTFNKDTSVTVFTGNVVLVSEGVKLKCDTLTSKNYKDNADAEGSVRAYYKAQKTNIKCGRIKYGNKMSTVKAFDGVIAEKYLDGGNTITMHADAADFETEYGTIEARKIKKRVKVTYKDIVAFSDKVIYNDETGEMEMTGKPVVKKTGSSFISSRIKIDTVKKTMKMERDIWTRIFYGDLKNAEAEVKLEADKNPAPH